MVVILKFYLNAMGYAGSRKTEPTINGVIQIAPFAINYVPDWKHSKKDFRNTNLSIGSKVAD